jgi:surface polysaccharide O-acyltransferase-like enzyme
MVKLPLQPTERLIASIVQWIEHRFAEPTIVVRFHLGAHRMASLTKASGRLVSVDIIRVLAMLMIVVLHTILSFSLRPDFFGKPIWFIFEPIVSLSKTGIILFFMLSGYLVIHKRRTVAENWQKTQKRILIPLLFFSVINLFFEFTKFPYDGHNGFLFWQHELLRVTSFPSSSLWFMVVLFFFYALNPVWQLVFDQKNKIVALYVTGLAALFAIITSIVKFPSAKDSFFFNTFTSWTGFAFLYLYGGLVKNQWVRINQTQVNATLFCLGFVLSAVGDYVTGAANAAGHPFWWAGYIQDFVSIPVIMMAVGAFNLILAANFSWFRASNIGRYINRIIIWFADLSFGIYLVHTYVVNVLTNVGFYFGLVPLNIYMYNVVNYSLVLGISTTIVYVVHKTPMLRAVIGE